MLWTYSGYITVHEEGELPREVLVVDQVFELPDRNVAVIQAFVQQQRALILQHKYHPERGEAPWGEDGNRSLMAELNRRQPPSDWWVGLGKSVGDRQTKALLIAYRQQLIDNVDLYFPSAEPVQAVA